MHAREYTETCRRDAEFTAEASAQAPRMQVMRQGPLPEVEARLCDDRIGKHRGPVLTGRETNLELGGQQVSSGALVFLRQPDDGIGIGHPPQDAIPPTCRHGKHEDLRATRIDTVDVRLMRGVDQDIARRDDVTAGIARLYVTPRQRDCGKGVVVPMTREDLARRVVCPPGLLGLRAASTSGPK